MGLRAAILLAALLVAGCGYKGQLTRVQAEGMERAAVKAARAAEADGIDRALAPKAEQRPVRVDDISIRLDARADDPFDLPPE